jgi:DNA repair protein RadC
MIHLESPPGTIPFVEITLNTIRTLRVEGREEVAKLCQELGLNNLAQEEIWAVSLDGDCKVRAVLPIAKGSYHTVFIDTAAILSAVLLTASDRFVLLHNHPSGDLTPTLADKNLTKELGKACGIMGMRFEDHLIVGPPNNWKSMRNEGLM